MAEIAGKFLAQLEGMSDEEFRRFTSRRGSLDRAKMSVLPSESFPVLVEDYRANDQTARQIRDYAARESGSDLRAAQAEAYAELDAVNTSLEKARRYAEGQMRQQGLASSIDWNIWYRDYAPDHLKERYQRTVRRRTELIHGSSNVDKGILAREAALKRTAQNVADNFLVREIAPGLGRPDNLATDFDEQADDLLSDLFSGNLDRQVRRLTPEQASAAQTLYRNALGNVVNQPRSKEELEALQKTNPEYAEQLRVGIDPTIEAFDPRLPIIEGYNKARSVYADNNRQWPTLGRLGGSEVSRRMFNTYDPVTKAATMLPFSAVYPNYQKEFGSKRTPNYSDVGFQSPQAALLHHLGYRRPVPPLEDGGNWSFVDSGMAGVSPELAKQKGLVLRQSRPIPLGDPGSFYGGLFGGLRTDDGQPVMQLTDRTNQWYTTASGKQKYRPFIFAENLPKLGDTDFPVTEPIYSIMGNAAEDRTMGPLRNDVDPMFAPVQSRTHIAPPLAVGLGGSKALLTPSRNMAATRDMGSGRTPWSDMENYDLRRAFEADQWGLPVAELDESTLTPAERLAWTTNAKPSWLKEKRKELFALRSQLSSTQQPLALSLPIDAKPRDRVWGDLLLEQTAGRDWKGQADALENLTSLIDEGRLRTGDYRDQFRPYTPDQFSVRGGQLSSVGSEPTILDVDTGQVTGTYYDPYLKSWMPELRKSTLVEPRQRARAFNPLDTAKRIMYTPNAPVPIAGVRRIDTGLAGDGYMPDPNNPIATARNAALRQAAQNRTPIPVIPLGKTDLSSPYSLALNTALAVQPEFKPFAVPTDDPSRYPYLLFPDRESNQAAIAANPALASLPRIEQYNWQDLGQKVNAQVMTPYRRDSKGVLVRDEIPWDRLTPEQQAAELAVSDRIDREIQVSLNRQYQNAMDAERRLRATTDVMYGRPTLNYAASPVLDAETAATLVSGWDRNRLKNLASYLHESMEAPAGPIVVQLSRPIARPTEGLGVGIVQDPRPSTVLQRLGIQASTTLPRPAMGERVIRAGDIGGYSSEPGLTRVVYAGDVPTYHSRPVPTNRPLSRLAPPIALPPVVERVRRPFPTPPWYGRG